MIKDTKGQTGGLITAIVFGIAALIITVIISLVITSTLNGSGLLGSAPTFAQSTLNEENGTIVAAGYQLGGAAGSGNTTRGTYVVTRAINGTNGSVIGSTLYTVNTDTGIVTNTTSRTWALVSFNYTYVYTSGDGTNQKNAADALSLNLTRGVDNVSSKIPTVLLVSAIVLILGILALFVGVWQRMKMSGGGI